MPILRIRLFGDPVLRERAHDVTTFDERLAKLADDMLATMRDAAGVGLAANQVGVLKRLFTWEIPPPEGEEPREGATFGAVVNPVVVETSEELQEHDEGCLSFPGLFYPTSRPLRARVEAVDIHGAPLALEGEGLLARILLHEIDHLNGILFLDHLARHDKKEALRRIRTGELERNLEARAEGDADAPPLAEVAPRATEKPAGGQTAPDGGGRSLGEVAPVSAGD